MPLISVITINYNNAIGLQKTVDSVVCQTYSDYEFIVIDGNSSDDSINIIKHNKGISKWISESDNGIYDAQNKGIAMATGNYLLFLNSGDELASKDILKSVSSNLTSQKSFYYGNLILEKNNIKEKHDAPKNIDLDFMLNSTFWHPCVFINAMLFKKFGLYNTSFKICGDYEFFIRCLLKPQIEAVYIDEYITLFDGNGISNNENQQQLQTSEREKAWKLNVSDIVYNSLKAHNSFSRSKYASVVNSLQKLRGRQEF